MRYIIAILSILFIGCTSARFNINEVDFSFENSPHNILPLEYHDRSNLNKKTADKIMGGVLAKNNDVWGYYYIHHDFDKNERKLFELNFFQYITDVLQILGMPKAKVYYDLKAYAYIFDSNGDIVEIYERSGSVMKYRGMYYGHNAPIEKMSGEYKKMFGEILNEISQRKDRTNHLLELSGAMNEEKTAEIYTKIYMIIK